MCHRTPFPISDLQSVTMKAGVMQPYALLLKYPQHPKAIVAISQPRRSTLHRLPDECTLGLCS